MALAQRIRTVRGLGPKLEERVLAALEQGAGERVEPRLLLPKAIELGERLAGGLSELGGEGTHVQIAGSARRWADSVKDVDLIAVTNRPTTLAKSLGKLELIASVGSAGKAGARGRTHSGFSVDLRIAKPAQLGNLLQHFTGSGRHNAALREAAVRRGLHVSEYGLLDDAIGRTRTCATEQEVYELLGLAYIEPELREDRGELDAARLDGGAGLPALIELGDIRGDLHSHTVASDGHNTIEEMALAARELGYEYLAITDHSATHGFGNDVSPEQLRRQIELVHEANERVRGNRAARGQRGQHPARRLARLRRRAARLSSTGSSPASHTSFGMDERRDDRAHRRRDRASAGSTRSATPRVARSSQREPYALDLEAVFAAAARTGTFLEINANPDRRDLSDVNARAAVRAGRDAADRLRRAPRAHAAEHALGRRDGAACLADARRRGQHAPLGRVRSGYASSRGNS